MTTGTYHVVSSAMFVSSCPHRSLLVWSVCRSSLIPPTCRIPVYVYTILRSNPPYYPSYVTRHMSHVISTTMNHTPDGIGCRGGAHVSVPH